MTRRLLPCDIDGFAIQEWDYGGGERRAEVQWEGKRFADVLRYEDGQLTISFPAQALHDPSVARLYARAITVAANLADEWATIAHRLNNTGRK